MARHIFVLFNCSVMAKPCPSPSNWAYCITYLRQKKSGRVASFQSTQKRLLAVVNALKEMQIEHKPFDDILKRYDSPGTLFYLDPPYISNKLDGDAYRIEMLPEQHVLMLDLARKAQGKVAISGYDNSLYSKMLGDWRIERKETRTTAKGRGKRVEVLWMNY